MITQALNLIAAIALWYTGSWKFRTKEDGSLTRIYSWFAFQCTGIISYAVICFSADAHLMTQGILNLDWSLYYQGSGHQEFPMLYAVIALWVCDLIDPSSKTLKKYSDARRMMSYKMSRVNPSTFKATALLTLVAIACFA